MGELFDSIELKTEISSFIESRLETRTKEIDFPIQGENSFVLKLEKRSKGSIVVLGLPIGEIKHMRTQLEQQKTKAEYSARLAALGEIAGGVAHEINNPLAVITMSADLLRNKLNAEKVSEGIWKKHTDKINETGKRIALIIKSLQNLSRESDDQEVDILDLTLIVEETLNLCREKFKHHEIQIDYQNPGEIFVSGKHVDVGQVIINLMNNAFDAVKASPVKRVSFEFLESGEYVHLLIKDTGHGVPQEIQDKLFQPFFTTKPFGEGSGLGLSISRSLLLKYGGEVQLIQAHDPTIFQVSLHKHSYAN